MSIHSALRSVSCISVLAGMVLVSSASLQADAPEDAPPVPFGLVALRPVQNTPRKDQDFIAQAVSNPFMSGVAYQIGWDTIEPAEGQFDWSRLDALFAAAGQSKKWVHLLIYPGFHSPAWALEGIKTESFAVQYGPGQGDVESLPMPWDRVYLGRWFEFLQKVGDRFGKSPAFDMVAAAGPTSVSCEMTLPESPADLTIWRNDGYTPKKYIAAYRAVFEKYAEIFPNQFVSLSLGDALKINDLGRIEFGAARRTRQTIIDEGVAIFGRRFVLQNSDLHAGPDQHPATAFVIGYSGKIITGLEERCSAEKGSAAMGADGDPPLALRKSIDLGMTPNDSGRHVNYLEIYEPDVIAEEMQPVLRYSAGLFGR
jgi:hypothetical protein